MLRGAIREISQASGVGILFAGLVRGCDLTITEFFGTRTASLKDLFVRAGEGVGGRALAQARPMAVNDYIDSRHITHRHDEAVRPEGLRMMVALPVLVDGTVRGVIYAANRETAATGDRRVALLRLNAAQPTAFEDYDLVETVRIAHAELLAVSRTAQYPAPGARIEHVMAQLDGSATARGPVGPASAQRHGVPQSFGSAPAHI